jgi:hypothetical protein
VLGVAVDDRPATIDAGFESLAKRVLHQVSRQLRCSPRNGPDADRTHRNVEASTGGRNPLTTYLEVARCLSWAAEPKPPSLDGRLGAVVNTELAQNRRNVVIDGALR